MLLQTLSAPQASVIAAVVGAIAGVTGGVVSTMAQRRLEAAKWPRGREDALAADLRTSIAGLITVAALTLPTATQEAHGALQEQYRRATALEHEFPRQIVEISTRAVRRREAHLLARR